MIQAKPFFCVVIPMFNEQAGVIRCVEAVGEVLRRLPVASVLIVVQDGSTDQTGFLLKQLEPRWNILRVVTHEKNMGYGRALVTGTRRAAEMGAKYVLFMDSDLTNVPADSPKFLAEMEKGVDVIKATRYSLGGGVKGVPWFRYLVSKYGNLVARHLLQVPLSDPTNGFRATKVKLLKDIDFEERGFPIIMEEVRYLSLLKLTYGNIPVLLTNRNEFQRLSSFRYSFSTYMSYLKHPLLIFLFKYTASNKNKK